MAARERVETFRQDREQRLRCGGREIVQFVGVSLDVVELLLAGGVLGVEIPLRSQRLVRGDLDRGFRARNVNRRGRAARRARPRPEGARRRRVRSSSAYAPSCAPRLVAAAVVVLDQHVVQSGRLRRAVERGNERAPVGERRGEKCARGRRTSARDRSRGRTTRSSPPSPRPGLRTTRGTWMSSSNGVCLPGGKRCWPRWKPLSDVNTMYVLSRVPVARNVSMMWASMSCTPSMLCSRLRYSSSMYVVSAGTERRVDRGCTRARRKRRPVRTTACAARHTVERGGVARRGGRGLVRNVRRDVHEERLRPRALDELLGLLGQPVDEISRRHRVPYRCSEPFSLSW